MKSNIIRDIVIWVECHLQDPLQLDVIAKKSGYSKWHLQREFKENTRLTLGTYVRYRRLSRVAIELKLTNNSMLDIATKYCFDSPQSFSRAFKRRFKISPKGYRSSNKWTTNGILPALYLDGDIEICKKNIGVQVDSEFNSGGLLDLPCSNIDVAAYEITHLNFY